MSVNLRFTATQLRDIHQGALDESNRAGDSNNDGWFSRQDVVLALLAQSFSQADYTMPPVRRFLNVINVRLINIHLIFIKQTSTQMRALGIVGPDEAGTQLLWAMSEPPEVVPQGASPQQLIVLLAKTLRSALLRFREPEHWQPFATTAGTAIRQAAFDETTHDFTPLPGGMTINSTWR